LPGVAPQLRGHFQQSFAKLGRRRICQGQGTIRCFRQLVARVQNGLREDASNFFHDGVRVEGRRTVINFQ